MLILILGSLPIIFHAMLNVMMLSRIMPNSWIKTDAKRLHLHTSY